MSLPYIAYGRASPGTPHYLLLYRPAEAGKTGGPALFSFHMLDDSYCLKRWISNPCRLHPPTYPTQSEFSSLEQPPQPQA